VKIDWALIWAFVWPILKQALIAFLVAVLALLGYDDVILPQRLREFGLGGTGGKQKADSSLPENARRSGGKQGK